MRESTEKPPSELAVSLTSRSALLSYVILGAVIVVAIGQPVPFGNEHHGLIGPYRLANPDFAPSEWTLSRPQYGHYFYELFVAGLMKILPMSVVAWIIRITSWTLMGASVLLIGAVMGIRPWMTATAVAVWVANGQSILAGDSFFRSADAKSLSFALLFFAVYQLLRGRGYRAALLIGLGTAFHPLAGVKLGGAICAGALFIRRERWRIPIFAAVVAAVSLIGVGPAFYGMRASDALTPSDWEFIARFVWPMHVDPNRFPRRAVLTLGVMLSFNMILCWKFRRDDAYRLFGVVQLLLSLFFGVGLLAWALGRYGFLVYMPFRVLPVLVPMLFALFFVDLARRRDVAPVPWALAIWGLLALGEPVAGLVDLRFGRVEAETLPTGAFEWIARETPNDATVLSPPSATNSLSISRRGQVAYYRALQLWGFQSWRARHEAVLGPLDDLSAIAASSQSLLARYEELTLERIDEIRDTYGATVFVTRVDYPLPLLHQDGLWRVYSLEE